MKNSHFDVIIIGTGFASSFFLKKFLEKNIGKSKILVLEKGPYLPHQKRLKARRSNETNIPGYWAAEKHFVNNAEDKSWKFDVSFGGSSNCWTGCTPRFLPDDFRMATKYGVGQDWPISYEDLDPFYTEAENIMQIAGPYITPFPRKSKYPLPPHKLSTFDEAMQKMYGNDWISQPMARASMPLENRGKCCSTSVCELCPVNSKFTIENTLDSLYQHEDVTLLLNAPVVELNMKSDVVNSVKYEEEGVEKKASADLFALGANAIFNPYLLLKSGDKHPLTGKGITEQAGTFAYLYLKDISNKGGSSVITSNGYMFYNNQERKDYAGCIIENYNEPFIRNEPGKWRHMAKLKFIFEDLPSDENFISVSEDGSQPVVNFRGRTEYCTKAMDLLPSKIKSHFEPLGIDKIEFDGYFQKTEYHSCSSVRMSKEPENGVIDENMVHHTYRNLLVLGSSSFPTISPSNPTLTLSALSLRAAEKLFN